MEEFILWFEKLDLLWRVISAIGGIIAIGSIIVPKIRNFFSYIFKWLFDKIWGIICTVCKWFKIIFTINKLEARVTILETQSNNQAIGNIKEDMTKSFQDERDGRLYGVVKIGDQTWLAGNLAFEAEGSICYNNSTKDTVKYGLLYNWETAKKAVPPGWHLPTDMEWKTLIDFAGGIEVAGKKLKAKSGWSTGFPNFNGTDDYDFSALPGGGSFFNGFMGININYWWTATEKHLKANSLYIKSDNSINFEYKDKTDFKSVRCIKDM
jgi:uncharacterized protein (TIGR02145 family)